MGVAGSVGAAGVVGVAGAVGVVGSVGAVGVDGSTYLILKIKICEKIVNSLLTLTLAIICAFTI